MELKAYAIYDSKIQAYGNPFFMRSKGEALRAFATACNDPQTNLCKFPADFTLFEIGSYDDQKGDLKPSEAHESLGKALEYKDVPKETIPMFNEKKGE